MNWLTPEQVKKAATTPEKALDVSILHWEQICKISEIVLLEISSSILRSDYCGLCTFHDSLCRECIIPIQCEDGVWVKTDMAYWAWRREHTYNAYRRFKYHAKKMLKLLRELKQKGSTI